MVCLWRIAITVRWEVTWVPNTVSGREDTLDCAGNMLLLLLLLLLSSSSSSLVLFLLCQQLTAKVHVTFFKSTLSVAHCCHADHYRSITKLHTCSTPTSWCYICLPVRTATLPCLASLTNRKYKIVYERRPNSVTADRKSHCTLRCRAGVAVVRIAAMLLLVVVGIYRIKLVRPVQMCVLNHTHTHTHTHSTKSY